MGNISWTDSVRNEEVLQREKDRNILQTRKRRKATWIVYVLRGNCRVKHIIEENVEGRIEVTGRRIRRPRRLQDDLKEARGYRKLKEETLDRACGEVALDESMELP